MACGEEAGGPSRVEGWFSISVHQLSLNVKSVPLVFGKKLIDAQHFHSRIDIADAEVANGSGYVEDEFAHPRRGGKYFGRNQNFTGKQAMKKVVLELIFTHAADIPKDGSSF